MPFSNNIFLIGPASVGKSTVAAKLATRLGFRFVDIDSHFRDEIALIPDYIKRHGYAAYCERNSELTDELAARFPTGTVFAAPAGFLIHEQPPHLIEKHLKLIDAQAVSVLLLPSQDPLESVGMIVDRQSARWPEVDPDAERSNYLARHGQYRRYGTIKIIGRHGPDATVDLVLKELQRRRSAP